MVADRSVTGVELDWSGVIISETDLLGNITMANDVFQQVAAYSETELIGAPHNILRHPDMPRCVFKLLWDTIKTGKSISAYVVNRTKNGDGYWVLATVTPKKDDSGKIIGYRSERVVPKKSVVEEVIKPLYRSLLEEEKKVGGNAGMESSFNMVVSLLKEKGISYDELIASLA
jgi:PAS domain S-box-containing protein